MVARCSEVRPAAGPRAGRLPKRSRASTSA